jgi:hypothetical protein
MKLGRIVAVILIIFLSGYALGTFVDRKVMAQSRPVELSTPRAWGRVVGVVRMNILFEAPDGDIREVSLIGGQVTVVTVLRRN